jgi:hypothetical protein
MAPPLQKRAIGLLMVAGVPISFTVYGIIQYSLGWQQSGPVILLFIMYVVVILSSVNYDASRMRQVYWQGVAPDLVDQITSTTSRGDFIYLKLIKSFTNHTKMSQSDLHEKVTKGGIDLTPPAVREYIIKLETAGLISTPPTTGTQAKQYSLTERGAWCQSIVKAVLPRSYFVFYLRNYLGIRRIPKEPAPFAPKSSS